MAEEHAAPPSKRAKTKQGSRQQGRKVPATAAAGLSSSIKQDWQRFAAELAAAERAAEAAEGGFAFAFVEVGPP